MSLDKRKTPKKFTAKDFKPEEIDCVADDFTAAQVMLSYENLEVEVGQQLNFDGYFSNS